MRISIKHKLTIFIILILTFNIAIVSFTSLKGIKQYQKNRYESSLRESSKVANLYIREQFLKSDSRDYRDFYEKNACNICLKLKEIIGYNIKLYTADGIVLQNNCNNNKLDKKVNIKLLEIALNNNITYAKLENDSIEYLAPIYDYQGQIGIMKLIYNIDEQANFYKNIRNLYIKFAILSIVIVFIVAKTYLMRIIKSIMSLRKSLELVENSKFDSVEIINSRDELGDLSLGIKSMAVKIKDNINGISKEKEKLRKVIIELERLEKEQKEFIGNITHEFKTPITVIKAQLDLAVLYEEDKDIVNKSRDIINKELKRLDNMVESILYLSSMEKYDFEFTKVKIDTKQLIEEICERMSAKASKYGISIYVDLVEAEIVIDKDSFMQVFINLIDNSIKYNKIGGNIYIRSYKKESYVIFEVEDTGIGIPKESRKHIFEPFYTVDKNRSKKHSGTGLGLSLVKKLLNKQGGDIKLMECREGTLLLVQISDSGNQIDKK